MTLFKKCLRLSQIHDLCISRRKNLIFSKGQRKKIFFFIFLPSSIILEAMKKIATSSFPKYFYANSPDVICSTSQDSKFQLLALFHRCYIEVSPANFMQECRILGILKVSKILPIMWQALLFTWNRIVCKISSKMIVI